MVKPEKVCHAKSEQAETSLFCKKSKFCPKSKAQLPVTQGTLFNRQHMPAALAYLTKYEVMKVYKTNYYLLVNSTNSDPVFWHNTGSVSCTTKSRYKRLSHSEEIIWTKQDRWTDRETGLRTDKVIPVLPPLTVLWGV